MSILALAGIIIVLFLGAAWAMFAFIGFAVERASCDKTKAKTSDIHCNH